MSLGINHAVLPTATMSGEISDLYLVTIGYYIFWFLVLSLTGMTLTNFKELKMFKVVLKPCHTFLCKPAGW